LNTIFVEELVGSLQTYESTLPHQKKGKSIAFKSVNKEYDNSSDNDFNSEDIALIARKFRKLSLRKRIMVMIKKNFAKRNELENGS
jgi:hypothetical protein